MAADRKQAFVCVPGVLSRAEELYRPLWLERFGRVEYVDFDHNRFDPLWEIEQVCRVVSRLHEEGYDITLFGSSLGVSLNAFVIERLSDAYADLSSWLEFVDIDGPAGSATFKATEKLPRELITSKFGSVFFAVLGWFILFIGRMGPGLPKDKYITRPSDDVMMRLAGTSDMSDLEWRMWVKMEFKHGLRGHSSRVWAQQLQWMDVVAVSGLLKQAGESKRDLYGVYVQCTDGNDVVLQPEAQEWWMSVMAHPDARQGPNVAAPHCGYLQMQREFEAVLLPQLL